MRIFDRDPREERAESLPYVTPAPLQSQVESAIDTVARRVIMRRAEGDGVINDWNEFVDFIDSDWDRIEARVQELLKELDRGQGPFGAAYELLKRRAERES